MYGTDGHSGEEKYAFVDLAVFGWMWSWNMDTLFKKKTDNIIRKKSILVNSKVGLHYY